LTVSIIAKNTAQNRNTQIRGGRLLNIGDGASTESAITEGGLKAYAPITGNTARVKGFVVVTSFGSQPNTFMRGEVTDLSSGRTIPFTKDITVLRERVTFDFDMNDNYFINFDGSSPTPFKDGTAEWLAEIIESVR